MLEFLLSGSGFSTLVIGLTLTVYWLIQKWKYSYPPGPRGLPLIGNLLQISQQELHKQAFEWSKKYGPVITIRLGHTPFVFVNKTDAALEVLVKKSTDFAARMLTPSIDVISYGGKDIAFSSEGPAWKLHRRISSMALRSYMKGGALEKRVHDAVRETFADMDQASAPVDPVEYVSFINGNIMTGLCFGGKYSFGDKDIREIMQIKDKFIEVLGVGTLEDAIPGLKYVYKTKAFRELEELNHYICEDIVRKNLNQAKETFNRDNIRHFVDNLLLARLEAEEEGKESLNLKALTEDHLVHTIREILAGGLDSLNSTITYAILHMIAFPNIQKKVQLEIDRVVGKDRLPGMADRPDLGYTEAVLHESMRLSTAAATGKDRLPAMADRPDLCYTEAVLHESMRVSSVAPTGVFHMTACDTEIAGHRIPKGTAVVINHWALHHDPDAWDEVDRFVPERYLGENGKLGPKPKSWLPFSAGKRVCLGEFVAKPELHLIFASLMQRYKWKMESGRCPDLEPTGSSFSLSAKPFKAIIEKRI